MYDVWARAGTANWNESLSRSGSSLVADCLGPEVSVDEMRVGKGG